jgi:hypothetical protein
MIILMMLTIMNSIDYQYSTLMMINHHLNYYNLYSLFLILSTFRYYLSLTIYTIVSNHVIYSLKNHHLNHHYLIDYQINLTQT